MKRLLVVLAIVTLSALTTSNAYAAWITTAGGTGRSTALSVSVPTNTAATPMSASSIHITWMAPSAPSAIPTQYVVRRTAPTTATVCTVTGATFACDDASLTANTTYTYTVEARVGANWTSAQSSSFSGTTNGTATLVVSPSPGSQTAGTAFNVVLTATTNGVNTDTTYTGSHAISFSGPSNSPGGNTPTYPATVTFVAGVGTASITLVAAQTVSIQATDTVRSGNASVTVVSATPNKLGYTTSTPSCASGAVIAGNGGSFISYASLFDAYGNSASAVALTTVSLTKSPSATGTLVPTSLTIPAGATQTASSFTFTLPLGNPPDVTVTASSGALNATQCIVKKN